MIIGLSHQRGKRTSLCWGGRPADICIGWCCTAALLGKWQQHMPQREVMTIVGETTSQQVDFRCGNRALWKKDVFISKMFGAFIVLYFLLWNWSGFGWQPLPKNVGLADKAAQPELPRPGRNSPSGRGDEAGWNWTNESWTRVWYDLWTWIQWAWFVVETWLANIYHIWLFGHGGYRKVAQITVGWWSLMAWVEAVN